MIAPTTIDPTNGKRGFYENLITVAEHLTEGEPDGVANMANVAALIFQTMPDINWCGFYRLIDDVLVLGPFQGKPACIRIAMGRGVCGTAAAQCATQRVEDVHQFAGHIACDPDSASELVVPVLAGSRLLGVLDIDSASPGRFDAEDQAGFEALIARIGARFSEAYPAGSGR